MPPPPFLQLNEALVLRRLLLWVSFLQLLMVPPVGRGACILLIPLEIGRVLVAKLLHESFKATKLLVKLDGLAEHLRDDPFHWA